MDINTIKLVIWDLDETLWQGTLSEEKVSLDSRIKDFIVDLTDAGIICSICSKNDYKQAKQQLIDFGLWELFVFPSINWDNKAMRLKAQIDQMALREQNVLFLDDNTFNLKEASFVMPLLQVGTPDSISELIEQLTHKEKKDKAHKRLQQYKILEQKASEALHYDSNEAFLQQSHIQVQIHTDCLPKETRLHELILRTNQLNFTKKRISLEALHTILTDLDYECGYITVTDRYGDYGIVGFYAMKNKTLEHFLFSCRTMGQMIEQWVYAHLGFPELEVVGEVRTQLNKTDCPSYINQGGAAQAETAQADLHRDLHILLKGPCDLKTVQSYLPKKHCSIDTEFTYIDDRGRNIDMYNHSIYIENAHRLSSAEQLSQMQDFERWIDPAMLDTQFFSGNYDVIFFSSLNDSAFGLYRNRKTGLLVGYDPIVNNRGNWDYLVSGRSYNGTAFTMRDLTAFAEQYEYLGYTTLEMYGAFLLHCLEWLPERTTLCILLGATLPMPGNADRIARHAALNKVVRELSKENSRLCYIDVEAMVQSSTDVADVVNHYQPRNYYEIGKAMTEVLQAHSQTDMHVSVSLLRRHQLKMHLKPVASYLKKHMPALYWRVHKLLG